MTINKNGKIKEINKISDNFQEVRKGILHHRLNVSNGFNIGLSNNIIVPFIFSNMCKNGIYISKFDNIRLTNLSQSLNTEFANQEIDNQISTYFTRLSNNNNLTEREKLDKFKKDFELNEVNNNFATILFECDRHVTTIVVDLKNKKSEKLEDILYLFDTSLEHSVNYLTWEQNKLPKYFGNFIQEDKCFIDNIKLQIIGNCAWLSGCFINKCSELEDLPRNEKDEIILHKDLVIDIINKTSDSMLEDYDSKFIFNENNEGYFLNKEAEYSKVVNIKNLAQFLKKNFEISFKNDQIKYKTDEVVEVLDAVYDKDENGEIDYTKEIEPYKTICKEITETDLICKNQIEKVNEIERYFGINENIMDSINQQISNLIFTDNECSTIKSEQEIVLNTKKYINDLENNKDIKNIIQGFKEIISINKNLNADDKQIVVISCFKAIHESKNNNIKQHMSEYIKSDTETKNKLIKVLNSSDNNRNTVKLIMKYIQENKQTSQIYK